MKHFLDAEANEYWQIPQGWLVRPKGADPLWVGPQQTWPEQGMIEIVPKAPIQPTTTPTPVPPPTPVPVPPNPEDLAQYDLVPVYVDRLEAGWTNRSWAPTTEVDEGAGDKAFESDIDAWKGFNLNGPERKIEEFAGVVFDFKASAVNDTVTLSIYNALSKLGTGMRLVGTSTDTRRVTALFEKMGMSLFGVFTNIVVEGGDSNQRSPMRFDNIYLLKRKTPLVAPPPAQAPQVTSAPATAGLLTLNAQGKFVTEGGEVWFGKGVNLIDFNSSNAAASVPIDRMLPELKRRLDFAKSNLNIDFMRYCIDRPMAGGVLGGGVAYIEALKEIVTYAWVKHGIRTLLSLWNEATLEPSGGKFSQGPTSATVTVWQYLAQAFAQSGHVMFGLCNEPESTAPANIERWRTQMVACGKVIRDMERREGGKQHIIVAQGGAWSRNLGQWKQQGLAVGGPVAYEYHDYQHEAAWESAFVQYARSGMPLLVGEFGPAVIQGKPETTGRYNDLTLADDFYWSLPREQAQVFALFKQHSLPCAAWALAIRCYPDILVDNSNGGAGVGMPLALTPWGQILKGLFA